MKTKQYTDEYLLDCPRISVYGDRIKQISTDQFDTIKSEYEIQLMTVHYDICELARDYNRGDVDCEFSPKQICHKFNGYEEDILKFYRSGLEQDLFILVEDDED